MYTHNFTLIKDSNSDKEILNLIKKEIEHNKNLKKDFLRLESNFPLKEDIINKLDYDLEITKYNFMYISNDKYKNLNGNKDSKVKIAKTDKILKEGIEVDILANKDIGNCETD